jgi:hypothetical protein
MGSTTFRVKFCAKCPWERERFLTQAAAYRAAVAGIKRDLAKLPAHVLEAIIGRQTNRYEPTPFGRCCVVLPAGVPKPFVACSPKVPKPRRK